MRASGRSLANWALNAYQTSRTVTGRNGTRTNYKRYARTCALCAHVSTSARNPLYSHGHAHALACTEITVIYTVIYGYFSPGSSFCSRVRNPAEGIIKPARTARTGNNGYLRLFINGLGSFCLFLAGTARSVPHGPHFLPLLEKRQDARIDVFLRRFDAF